MSNKIHVHSYVPEGLRRQAVENFGSTRTGENTTMSNNLDLLRRYDRGDTDALKQVDAIVKQRMAKTGDNYVKAYEDIKQEWQPYASSRVAVHSHDDDPSVKVKAYEQKKAADRLNAIAEK